MGVQITTLISEHRSEHVATKYIIGLASTAGLEKAFGNAVLINVPTTAKIITLKQELFIIVTYTYIRF